ncbi:MULTISPECIES: arsenate-mycothiol transferase ArsC [Aminobacter]|jgi:protein-tyrosine-phosphatase|uniref:Arsenate reductase n=2 Tax=Aminobacter TaxID=31988 RepID=A0AAC9ASY4_AMIAI|nr:arsenate reductase [Aminobacter aminovorans]MBB3705462.1 protein-tyrosine-phosphatase [Aminobacter aminovorans]
MAENASAPRSILFMCRMNSVRSPMAEAIARHHLPASVFVTSAGVRAGDRDPFVDAVLAEEGMGLDEHQPRTVDDLEDDYFDLIVTLAPEAHHAALEFTRSMAVDVEYWPTPDPTAVTGTRDQIMHAYRDVRERLKHRMANRFAAEAQGNDAD